MKQNKNLACRIFKEQIDLIQQLPESERAEVLYKAILSAFNQIENQNDNQIENQNEYAYVSVSDSLSVLSKTVYSLLEKNIVCKEFSSNYGGRRIGAGRPVKEIEKPMPVPQPTSKQPVATEENKAKVHNALEIFGNAFKGTDAVVGVFDRPDGSQREGIQIKNPHLMAFVKHRFDKKTLEKVSDWAIDHNQRGHTYNATSLLKLLCKFQSNIEPSINFNHVQSEYLTFEQQR